MAELATTSAHELREFATLDEYKACVALQEETWGVGFSERVPTAILKVAQSLGGVAAGAFGPGGRLDGFVFGLTGLDDSGDVVHWSDMLAVRPGAGGSGLATRLKAFQRIRVMERGVRRMLWTFDPLRARNAHLNLNKLGAVVREYRPDMYGDTDSALHRGIGTDRFLALWLLDSDRVTRRMGRALEHAGPRQPARPAEPTRPTGPVEPTEPALTAVGPPDAPRPGVPRLGLDADRVRVAIPPDIGAIMERDSGLAAAWRAATREVLTHYLERGYEVDHFDRAADAAPSYVLAPTVTHPSEREEEP